MSFEASKTVAPAAPVGRRPAMLAVADVLLRNQSALVRTLTEIATHASATDEINRSLMALAGAAWEIERARPPNTGTISVFHPSNNVLYAYVLYAVIPCLFANRVVVRPSARATRPVLDVHGLITNSVEVTTVTQREFLSTVAGSDVVVFTGRYDNALSVAGGLRRDQLLVYFGGGLNPIVVGAEADLEAAARDSVRARLYNSGQDCLCPDVIFVQDSVSEVFMRALLHELTPIRLAESRTEVGARLAPIYYYDILPRLERFLEGCQDRIVFGGHIDRAAQTVQPTVLVSDLDAQPVETEFFAPVFNVVRYRQPEALRNWLLSKRAVEHAMYLSVYGEPELAARLSPPYTVCTAEIPLDVEHGNRPFGGFGVRAGFAQTNGAREGRPLLISGEVARAERGALRPAVQ